MRIDIEETRRDLRDEIHEMEKRLQASIDKKRDKTVASLEVANMHSRLAIIEKLSKEAKEEAGKPHVCHQGEALQEIRSSISSINKTLNSWRTLKLGAIIALLIALLSGAWFVFQLKGEQAVLNVKVTSVEDSVAEIKDSTSKGDSRDVQILETLRSMQEDIKSVKTFTIKEGE
jgi:hypothetical protein